MSSRKPGGRHQRTGPAPGGAAAKKAAGPTQARLLAVRVLERVERVRSYADLALNQALARSNLPAADRALTTEIVYGTLRWRGRIDWVLAQAIDRKLEDLEPLVVTALRAGAYQLLFMDRVPERAAVDETVRCVRALHAERATGLANAVLRRVAREHGTWSLPALADDPVAHVRDALSMPDWLARRFVEAWGPDEAAAFAEACNHPPPLTVRVNAARHTPEALLDDLRLRHPEAARCVRAPYGLVLGRKGDPRRDARFLAGDFTVQDEASQLVIEMLDPQPSDRVLDVCAAPGTKTTGIAERLGPAGRVLALDRHAERLKLVARAARRLGLGSLRTIARDATRPLDDLPALTDGDASAAEAPFDRVLVDAPCSGIGSLRRNPDARWRVEPEDPERLAAVQGRILDRAAAVLGPGGALVYSTCTVLPEENEHVVEAFLASHDDFRLAGPDELPESVRPWVDDRGLLHTRPHRHDADGFFAARLVPVVEGDGRCEDQDEGNGGVER